MKVTGIIIGCFLLLASFMTSCQKEILVPNPVEVPDTVSFAADVIPIFNESCNMSGCHITGGISPNLTPENAYFDLTITGMIDVDDPEGSLLYTRMISTTKPMPPAGKLADGKLEIVLKWIQQGGLDN